MALKSEERVYHLAETQPSLLAKESEWNLLWSSFEHARSHVLKIFRLSGRGGLGCPVEMVKPFVISSIQYVFK